MNPSRTVLRGDCALAMMSGKSPSRRSIPSPERTSLSPCAAPCRSTPDVSVLSVLNSPGTRSGKWISPSRSTSVPRDLAAVARASGTGSTSTTCTIGSKLERYGTKSFESVSDAKLPTICAAFFFPSAPRSLNPRSMIGMTYKNPVSVPSHKEEKPPPYERQRRMINVMHKGRLEQRRQRVCRFPRIHERLEQRRHQRLDLRVTNDLSKLF